MKIAFINGSPKTSNSGSETILKTLKKLLSDDDIVSEYNFRTQHPHIKDIEQIAQCDVMVFAFPLYVDGIPSHLVSCLYDVEKFFKANQGHKIKAYALVNCGFYEGKQCSLALQMMQNWCRKCGISWGQGIGIGAGGMLPMISNVPEGKGPKKNMWEALGKLADNISTRCNADNLFTSPNIPRFAYKFGAEMGWRQTIKANGLRTRDLFLRK